MFGAAMAGAPAGKATGSTEEWAAWAAGQRNEARQPDDAEILASRDAAPESAPESAPSPSAAAGPKLPSLDGVGVAEPEVVAPEALLPAVPPAPSVLGPVVAAAPVPAAPVALPAPVAAAPVSLPVPAAPVREVVTPVAESAGEATDTVGRSVTTTLERPVETVDSAAAPVTSLVTGDRPSEESRSATSEGSADLPTRTDRQEEVAEALTALGVLAPAETPASSGPAQQTEELVAEGTQQSGPAQTAPEQTAPEQTAPEQTAPEQTAPAQTAPEETAPAPTAPAVQEALAAAGTPQSAPVAAAPEGVSEREALSLADQWIARMTTGATERGRLPELLAQAPSRGAAVAGQPERRVGADDTSARTATGSAAGDAAPSRTVPEETTPDTTGRDSSDLPRAEEASDGAIEQRVAEFMAAQQQAAQQQAAERQAAEQRVAERKAAEQKAAERKAAERKAAEQEAAEQKAAERRAEQKAAEREAAEQRATERRAAAERAERQRAEEEQKASEQCSTDASSLSVSVKQNDEGQVTTVRISGFDEHCSGRTAHVTVNTEDGGTSATKTISGSSVTVSLDEPVDPSSVRSTEVSVG
ncbi:hypothetical protein DMP17_39710 [Pseudonocardia sp. TMWB2A]